MSPRRASALLLWTLADRRETADEQLKDPALQVSCASFPEVRLTFYPVSQTRCPVPCGLLRRVCDDNKTHYWHSRCGKKSIWVDWPSLGRRAKFFCASLSLSLPLPLSLSLFPHLLLLPFRYSIYVCDTQLQEAFFPTNTSTEISNQPSKERRYRHLSGNAPISFFWFSWLHLEPLRTSHPSWGLKHEHELFKDDYLKK